MPKKLYCLEVDPAPFNIYVFAEDEAGARKLAKDHASEEHDNIGFDCYIGRPCRIDEADDVDEQYLDSLPYGEEDLTIAELLEKAEAEAPVDAP